MGYRIASTRFSRSSLVRLCRVETAVRMQKDVATLAKASGDMKAVRVAQANIDKLMEYYDKISEESRIKQEYGRVAVQGYKHSGLQETLKGDKIEPYKAMQTALRTWLTIPVKCSSAEFTGKTGELQPTSIPAIIRDQTCTPQERTSIFSIIRRNVREASIFR